MNKKSQARLICGFIFGVILISIFSLYFIFAQQEIVDETLVKIYDEPVGDYGEIIIKKDFGSGADLKKYSIDFNTDTCLEDCYTLGTAVLYENSTLFSDLKFFDTENNEKGLSYSKLLIEKEREVIKIIDNSIEICEVAENSSKSCHYELNGTHKETTIETYLDEYKGEVLKAGTYKWKVEGKKRFDENIDFKPFIDGIRIDEWVWWNATYVSCKN